jgi:3'-phosphoadenosine 5'-phosphosulfate sulfotransferase (PAPS reductase)/FAD synthetase
VKLRIVSISGGKDSTACALLALERYPREEIRLVFADTGNEHEQTYAYVHEYLPVALGLPIHTVRADFSEAIERKRRFIAEKWAPDLVAGTPGKWKRVDDEDDGSEPPAPPQDQTRRCTVGGWEWKPGRPPVSEEQAADKVARALAVLRPTGVPFLDLCLIKGRFPSRMAQFCTSELKVVPITEWQMHLIDDGYEVESWQGIRADESPKRAGDPEREDRGGGLTIYRPILRWTAQQTVDYVRSRGVILNPLYSQGMHRVGCMPCINARKDEVNEIAKRFPEHVERIEEWERLVAEASKRDASTFFASPAQGTGLTTEEAVAQGNIRAVVEWARTSRGGVQFDWVRDEEPAMCASAYGLCE